MELVIIRHGEAAPLPMDVAGPPLSEGGVRGIERLKGLLLEQDLKVQALFASPLRRARQTAEILKDLWDLPIRTVEWLQPGTEPSRILKELEASGGPSPLIVGHLPALGWVLSTLVWGLPPKEISLPKGSATYLEVGSWEPSGAKIRWMLNPDLKRSTPE